MLHIEDVGLAGTQRIPTKKMFNAMVSFMARRAKQSQEFYLIIPHGEEMIGGEGGVSSTMRGKGKSEMD